MYLILHSIVCEHARALIVDVASCNESVDDILVVTVLSSLIVATIVSFADASTGATSRTVLMYCMCVRTPLRSNVDHR